jgi:predicted MFS family arabinose efflux permease
MSSRAVVVLSLAGFASAAAQRCSDPLLPLLAEYFGTTAGGASAVITAFAVAYGALQLVNGPIADRIGKFRMIFWVTSISAAGNLACAFAPSLPLLVLARFASGATIGAIAPLAIAWIGDAVPYERRQPVLARLLIGFLTGGALATMAAGALGEHFGWRSVFFALSGLYVVVAVLLWRELRGNPATQSVPGRSQTLLQSFAAMFGLLRNPWVRTVLATVSIEGALSQGSMAFAAFHAHSALGLSVTLSGILVGCVALGGLLYALLAGRLVPRLGERGLVIGGGLLLCAGLPGLAFAPGPLWAIPCLVSQGMGLMMMHNTLQVHGTQMSLDSRGAAMALFAFSLFTGQAAGVWVASLVVDARGTVPVFLAAGIGLVALAYFFQRRLAARRIT